jgi:hypothetical protein
MFRRSSRERHDFRPDRAFPKVRSSSIRIDPATLRLKAPGHRLGENLVMLVPRRTGNSHYLFPRFGKSFLRAPSRIHLARGSIRLLFMKHNEQEGFGGPGSRESLVHFDALFDRSGCPSNGPTLESDLGSQS